jgi:anthranilate synthase component 1
MPGFKKLLVSSPALKVAVSPFIKREAVSGPAGELLESKGFEGSSAGLACFYAGLVGYLEPEGNLDTCITIRSALKKEDVITLRAGAGVVLDSSPERELEETSEKLRALTSAIGVEE